jgi:hypothetical protein
MHPFFSRSASALTVTRRDAESRRTCLRYPQSVNSTAMVRYAIRADEFRTSARLDTIMPT